MSTSTPTVHALCFWEQSSYVNVNIHSYSACSMFLRTIISCQCQHPLLQCMLYVFENNHLMSMSTSTPTVHALFFRTIILCHCQYPLLQCMLYASENNHLMSMSTSTPTAHTQTMPLKTTILCQCQHPLLQCMPYVFENHHLMSMSTSTHTVHALCFWEPPPHVNVNIHSYTLCSREQACSTINTRMFEIKNLPNSLQSNTIIIFQNLLSVKHKFTYKTKAAQSSVENMSTFWGMGWGNYAYCPHVCLFCIWCCVFVCVFVVVVACVFFYDVFSFCGVGGGGGGGGGACLCPRNKKSFATHWILMSSLTQGHFQMNKHHS